jgi:hypothetical protein
MRLHKFIVVLIAVPLALSAGCAAKNSCPKCQDVVTAAPWSPPETHTYTLTVDGKDKGTEILSVERAGEGFVVRQLAADGQGNSDESSVTLDGATLKPLQGTRTIVDSAERKIAESTYEDADKGTCSSGRIVHIKQSTFKPPTAEKPDSTRSNPMCVPEHAYDNDSSLFLWRAIKFEKGYTVSYTTVLANRRDTQTVTLRVRDQVKLDTAAGAVEAWLVDIETPSGAQRAWFATASDHRLVRYENGSTVFVLKN